SAATLGGGVACGVGDTRCVPMATTVLIWSRGSSVNSHLSAGRLGATVTWRLMGEKPVISTVSDHVPSGKSAKVYTPCWSVTLTSFLSLCVAVMVAPGTG